MKKAVLVIAALSSLTVAACKPHDDAANNSATELSLNSTDAATANAGLGNDYGADGALVDNTAFGGDTGLNSTGSLNSSDSFNGSASVANSYGSDGNAQ